jgi:hypothetical protein
LKYIEKLIELIKLSPKYLTPIFLVSSFILFGNEEILGVFGLFSFRETYKPYIGIICLFSASLILSSILSWLIKKFSLIRRLDLGKNYLKNLTPYQKKFLRNYFETESISQNIELCDGEIRELEYFSIIYRSSNVSVEYYEFAYNLTPWARKFLKTNLLLLK